MSEFTYCYGYMHSQSCQSCLHQNNWIRMVDGGLIKNYGEHDKCKLNAESCFNSNFSQWVNDNE